MNSSNYDPSPCWSAGSQMVALNFHTHDAPMRTNKALFAQNGGCGYLLKQPALGAHAPPCCFRIEIVSAHNVPKPGEGRLSQDGREPWSDHVPSLNAKSSPPSATPPPDVRFTAAVGGDISATISNCRRQRPPLGGLRLDLGRLDLGARPNTIVARTGSNGEDEQLTTVESEDVRACGLQAVYNHTVLVTCQRPDLAVLQITFQALPPSKSKAGFGNKVRLPCPPLP